MPLNAPDRGQGRSGGAPPWADHPSLVDYYTSHRSRPDELYPSEARFLPWLAARADSVLDVGCGAGGFASIWRAYGPSIRYTGVDVSAPLVQAARETHPEHRFLQADCAAGLPLEDRFADVAVALGWLHWEERYARALQELWRVAGRYLFFDLRLLDSPGKDVRGAQRLELTGKWDGRTTVPYLCLAWPRVAEMLLKLSPGRVLAHGYRGRPAGTVMGMDGEICFATIVLERPASGVEARPEVVLDIPLRWPAELAGAVRLLEPTRLDELMGDAPGAAR